jgi:Domain of unknown function (DUF4388)
MQQSRFIVLTGHLNDYPLSDLVGILRHQQKTGRLLIEFAESPAMLYFKDGELVDVQFDKLSGLQAICVALAQPPASFNFNPLIQPSRRSIERSLQKVVSELLGCWDENAVEIEKIVPAKEVAQPTLSSTTLLELSDGSETTTQQALTFSTAPILTTASLYSSPVFVMAAAGVLMLGLSAVIGVSGGFSNSASSASVAASAPAIVSGSGVQASSLEPSGSQTRPERRSESKAQRELTREKDLTSVSAQLARKESQISPIEKAVSPDLSRSTPNLSQSTDLGSKQEKNSEGASPKVRAVKVILQVENGRVAQASIGNHGAGMDAYEALALRIARQRRYPSKTDGQEIVTIKVSPPE